MKDQQTTNEMSATELEDFLIKHDLRNQDFVEMLGVTKPALDHWLRGRRAIPATTVKLIRFFDKYPEMMSKF